MRVHGGLLWVAAGAAVYGIAPVDTRIMRTLVPPAGEVVDLATAQTGGGTGSTAGRPVIDIYTVVEPPWVSGGDQPAFSEGPRGRKRRPIGSSTSAKGGTRAVVVSS